MQVEADKIKRIRAVLNLNQSELAFLIGCHAQTVYRMEKGQFEASPLQFAVIHALEKIAISGLEYRHNVYAQGLPQTLSNIFKLAGY